MKSSCLKIFAFFLICLISFGANAETHFLNGAGASFPFPIYSKWFAEYKKSNPDVEINYQSVGSGAGIRQLMANTVDFGASDAPMNMREMKKTRVPVVHIPAVIGTIVVSYNIPGLTSRLKLSGDVLAKIFMGEISKWNDPAIQKINQGADLPNLKIAVVHRSDSSGTTYVFTDYLSKVSADWKTKVGNAKTVRWPTGLGGRGNPGVAGQISNTPGAIGYIEYNYAFQNKLSTAMLQNAAGEFIAPSKEATTKAAEHFMAKMPKDFRVSITNPPGKGAYPIASFTYLLAYEKMPGQKAKVFTEFLDWAMGPGQKMAGELSYAPLPKSLISRIKKSVKTISAE